MRTLLPEQREALIDALIEMWQSRIEDNFRDLREVLDDWLFFGRRGYRDYTDDQLVDTAEESGLHGRITELGIKTED